LSVFVSHTQVEHHCSQPSFHDSSKTWASELLRTFSSLHHEW
jgi:hypothetical protein